MIDRILVCPHSPAQARGLRVPVRLFPLRSVLWIMG